MNDLRPLIRLHRWRIDEKRRGMVELQTREEQLLEQAAAVEAALKEEQILVRETFDVAFGYANFARATINRRKALAQALADVRDQLAIASNELAEAFQELKRYELAQEERVRQQREKIRHKENEMLDETAEIGFRRRQQADREANGGER